MLLLVVFAFVAGAATALTPCVLPVLPALLSASASGGARRPAGVVAGLALTFFATIVALASVVDGIGLAEGGSRTLAVLVLAGFGLALIVPALGHRLESLLAGLSRFGPRSLGSGFWSGMVVGGALGFVYAPCAGPILAAVISVSAAQGATLELLATAAAYAAGSSAVLLAFALGGRRVLDRVRRGARGPWVQRAFGLVMLLTAVAMATDLDVRFQTTLAGSFPGFVVNPTRGLERSERVEDQLARLREPSRFAAGAQPVRAGDGPALARLGAAPELAGTGRWFNTDGGRPLRLAALRGRVVLVDFWTYTCINCLRTLPYVRALDARYRTDGLTVVGVHTPEFTFERDAGNVADAVDRNRLAYPVAQDNDYATWNAFGNQYWPAKYLIDAEGQVRYTHFGEGAEEETEAAVRALLREAGTRALGSRTTARGDRPAASAVTPETYLGTARADRFLPARPRTGTNRYPPFTGALPTSRFALGGTWRHELESATAVRDARIDVAFRAGRVFLVLGSRGGRSRPVRVELDGRPIRAAEAGEDVWGGAATVTRQRLYRLVALPAVADRRLTLRLPPGVTGYAFTFG